MRLALCSGVCLIFMVLGPVSRAETGWGKGLYGLEPPPATNVDVSVPRGYIVHRIRPALGGADLDVDIYHHGKNENITVSLQAVINDGQGNLHNVTLKNLDQSVNDNPNGYLSHRTFHVNYDELNQYLADQAPAAKLKVGTGTPLFVQAFWDENRHYWGGPDRGGTFYLPAPTGGEGGTTYAPNDASYPQTPPTVLDVAVVIPQTMANTFNEGETKEKGLKAGGQVRSRLEAEGKYQVRPEEFGHVKERLFALAKDPVLAARILGPEWTIKVEDRYLKRDAQNQLVTDGHGFPVPDPMVDTYYDNPATRGAAKNDMALRYRWTEGNQTGAWNFKPGMASDPEEGIVYRLEYGIDTTDDQPDSLKKFADSQHPLNALRLVPQMIPGADASSYLHPSVRITDHRYKFKLEHASKLAIEVSLDDVLAESLDPNHHATARYHQMEMDIEHLATTSTNQGSSTQAPTGYYAKSAGLETENELKLLKAGAFFDGRPVLHGPTDLDPSSPVRQAHAGEFALAGDVIKKLREHTLGKSWLPGSQKYALAAAALGLIPEHEQSPSVRALLEHAQVKAGAPHPICLMSLLAPPAAGALP